MVSKSAVVVAAILALSSVARADDGIALEVFTGDRSPDASRLLSPILDELAKNKISSGDTVGRLFETAISRPARTQKGMPADFSEQADRGFKLWAQGKFDESIKTLLPLVELAHANSGAFAKDTNLREPLRKAMIGLALAQQRNGDLGAMRSTFEEMVRSYPDATLSRATFGPEAAQSFEEVKKGVAAQGIGKLTVVVDNGVVFVDEAYRGSGTTKVEVPPGEYRVVVIANDQPSRTHYVTVHAGGEAAVVVDATFDQSVRTSGWTGFQFANAAARDAHEAGYAAQLAHDIGAKSVALVGIDNVKGRPSIVGSLISLETGREIRRASIALEPDPSTERLKALAKFLAGEAPAEGLEVAEISAKREPAQVRHEEDAGGYVTVDRRWSGWRWLSLVPTVGLLGTSAYLYHLNGECRVEHTMGSTCVTLYDNSPADRVTLIAGIPFAALSIYLFATQTTTVPARTAYLVPTRNGAVAGYAFAW